MKAISKLTGILLALTMVLGLAACGKTGGNTSADPSTSDGDRPKLTIGINTKANIKSYDDNALTRWLEEQTGYDLEFVFFSADASEWRTQLTTMIAGGERLPDILWGHGWNAQERNTYGQDGYLIDQMQFFGDEEFMQKNYPWYEERVEALYGEGHLDTILKGGQDAHGALYGFPSIGSSESDLPQNMVYINTEWLEAVGKEIPTTYEEFVDVLRAFQTGDPNGNGKQDEIPAVGATAVASSDLPSWIINNWEFVNDAFLFNVTDGKLWLPYTTDNYRKGLQAVHDLVDEGLLSTLTWTITEVSEMNALWTPADNNALCGVFSGHILLRTTTDSPLMYQYAPLMPFNNAPLKKQGGSYYGYITSDCENPEAAFNLLMQFATEEGTLRTRYGVPEVDWTIGTDAITGRKGVHILNTNAYSGQTDSTWGGAACIIAKYDMENIYTSIIADAENMTWADSRNTTNRTHGAQYVAVANQNNPDELIYDLVYSPEEEDENGNIKTDLLSFIKEARAQFASGERDPYNDADWAAYVKSVEDIGAATLTKNAQSAYDRSKQ